MCGKFKLLFSMRRYSAWDQFLGFSRYFRFLIDVGGYFRSLVNVGGYLILVEFSGIVRYGVDISGNLRLNRFLKFWFGVKVVYYRVFLLIMGGGK